MEPEGIKSVLTQGVLGMAGTGTGVAISLSTAIQWLQLLSLSVGLVVGILTAIGLLKKLFKD